jgi:hypothetical protein
LKKSFVLYNVIEVEGELVDCIYFIDDECRAQINTDKDGKCYKPTEEEQKKYCKNLGPDDFTYCTRYRAYQSHLEKIGLKK